MSLSAPTMPLFVVSVILVALAILGTVVIIPVVTPYAFWVAIIGYVVLLVGCLLKEA